MEKLKKHFSFADTQAGPSSRQKSGKYNTASKRE